MTSAPDQASLNTLSVGTAGPRVAFLHGLFGQGRNWTQIAKAVSGPDGADARCLLVDMPDHGRSPWSQEFSLDAYADAVAATLRATAPGESWMVVGHSLGGKVAMVLALRHPELVGRLVVVDIAPKGYGSLE
ncbi:MAG: alpha/beta hydrolase, partial [Dermatophilaceae bacterium]|nr:alpha/beta hydrolase [Dermatophilaceae bacterium]